jgi:hypothetical protein
MNRLIYFALAAQTFGCGKSIFQTTDKVDPATDAAIALEKRQPERAITLILSDLGQEYRAIYDDLDDATDTSGGAALLGAKMAELISAGKIEGVPNLVSILASAKAQLHGIDPFDLALKVAESATSESSSADAEADFSQADPSAPAAASGNQVTVLFPVLPAATDENLHGLDVAMAVLQSVGDEKTAADDYKEALFLTASIALVSKTLDSDGDGEISALEAITLSDAAAATLLNQIMSAAAAAAASSGSGDDAETAKSTEQIQALQSKIDAEEGDTQEEKLRNFMAKSGQT